MNYDAFMEPITWFLTGMEKHSDEYRGECFGNPGDFEGAMRHHMTRFMTSSLQCAMNELSNHDHSRFLTRTNKKVGRAEQLGTDAAGRGINKGVMKEAVVFQMTWPGAPTLYYGDEAGFTKSMKHLRPVRYSSSGVSTTSYVMRVIIAGNIF